MRKILFFELNEVPFEVVDYFCRKYPQSKLAALLPKMLQYETVTDDKGHLSPWITWPTLHRGVSNELHQIKDFGEDLTQTDKKYPPVWKILTEAGKSCGVFASMHTYPMPANYAKYAFFVPDPFSGDSKSHPSSLEPFQAFNLAMSRKSARNVDGGIDMKSALQVGISLPGLGIGIGTMAKVGRQLLAERTQPHLRTRRRTYQSVLAFDIFMRLMRKNKPDFATYFSNHVASAMHRYWAAAFPNHYQENKMDKDWLDKYKGEIDFAMGEFDSFLGKLVGFVDSHPEYQLWISSSMGQKATKAEMVYTESYCRDMKVFVEALGLKEGEWEPRSAMHPQYNLNVADAQADAFASTLEQLIIAGKPIPFRRKDGFFSIDLGHKNLPDANIQFRGKATTLEAIGLSNEAIDDETGSTAYHVKEGILLIYDSKQSATQPRKHEVTTRAIVPSILENFGVKVPDYMTKERIA